MRNGKRNFMFFVAIMLSLIFMASPGVAGGTDAGLSEKDEDAFILYRYSLMDAKKNRSAKIKQNSEGNRTTYEYDGHALSCRTVMTGSITRTASEDRIHVVGSFDVSNNSYGITQLSFDFYDEGSRTRTGTMTVDDKVIDIDQFDHR
jgi:hypothetical protein